MPSDVAIPPYPRDVPEKQIADLAAARARSGIDASRMTAILFSPDATAKRRRALAIVEREPLLTEAIAEWPFIGRTERMRRLMPIVVGFWQCLPRKNWT